ncbi:MAG: hypothetical protein H7267_08585 [Sandarakinorhabdus sp.]|nr:hypothetical protein [Sandarakinorhabdus sp.]
MTYGGYYMRQTGENDAALHNKMTVDDVSDTTAAGVFLERFDLERFDDMPDTQWETTHAAEHRKSTVNQ